MACEKCWGDAFVRHLNNPSKSQAEHYVDLLEERKDKHCSKSEQEGQWQAVEKNTMETVR
jgi:hypothetical protein